MAHHLAVLTGFGVRPSLQQSFLGYVSSPTLPSWRAAAQREESEAIKKIADTHSCTARSCWSQQEARKRVCAAASHTSNESGPSVKCKLDSDPEGAMPMPPCCHGFSSRTTLKRDPGRRRCCDQSEWSYRGKMKTEHDA